MKVLFIYPDVGTTLPPDYQHGIGTLIAILKREGVETSLLYLHQDRCPEEKMADEFLAAADGEDLIAFSSVTNQFPRAVRLARLAKEKLSAPIAIGGIHATLAAEETMAETCFDILCRGEGEGAIIELVHALDEGRDYSRIENLWVRQGNEVMKNPVRPLIEDLDSIPFADRDSFDFARILEAQSGKCSMLSGRGCPYGCTYCANEGLRGLYKGKGRFVRQRSVDHILAEMREIKSRYAVKVWDFNDDIFTLKRSFVEEFCRRYPAEFDLPFHASIRVETVERDMLKMLKDAGCELARIGLESGSERVRREVLGRPMRQESILRVFEDAEAAGLKTWSFNMVGAPGETEDDARETIALNEILRPDHMQVSVFNPYPGTRLYDVAIERGVLKRGMRDGYFLAETSLDLPEFPPERIGAVYRELIRARDVSSARKRLVRMLGRRRIHYDFVDRIADAQIETPDARFTGEDYFWIGEDCRRVLRAHPPARVKYRVEVPDGAELIFSAALHPEVLGRGEPGGVIFKLRIGRFGGLMKEVYSKKLDPKAVSADRGWHDAAIPLERWAGKTVWIEFVTGPGDPAHPEHNTAGFGYPAIVEKA